MQGYGRWQGKEVEGRLSGIMTFFVREPQTFKRLLFENSGFPHCYFTTEFIEAAIKNTDLWERIHELVIDETKIVTIEVTGDQLSTIPHTIFHKAHILLRVSVPGDGIKERMLKQTDSIAVDIAPYRTMVSTVSTFQQVFPEDYSNDTTL